MTGEPPDENAMRQVFTVARTSYASHDKPESAGQFKAISNIMKLGRTATNGFPARIGFVKYAEATARCKLFVAGGLVQKRYDRHV